MLARIYRKGNSSTLLVGMKIGAVIMESPQKTKNGTTISPNNSTAGYMVKEH